MSATWHMSVVFGGGVLLVSGGGLDRWSGLVLSVFVGASLAELAYRLARAMR